MNSKGQYPTQPTYPVQPPGNLAYPQTLHLPQAPPGYSELSHPSFVHPEAATVPTVSAAFAGTSPYLLMAQSVAVGPLGSTIPVAYYPVGPIYPLHSSSTWMPSQCCSAGSHAGSQCPRNLVEGQLLHGWLRPWPHHLVRNQGRLCAEKDIIYLLHFSQCNRFSHINLKLQFTHMLLGSLSGAQTFRHFSNIRNHVMIAVPP
ncbi:DAZ-associated protein 2-like [Sciurus carolinensis]|uniref:DAZ-associated protein 2-like n=1 Tax=Sciurus carolinensis TaxID=30640 RepID=UPI001FB22EA2|nr:DAZ-associated protein 2-like [Sciurus carolinensis]